MSKSGLIVFVTFEVFPFTGGGIGRFMYNTLKSMTDEERKRTVVILTTGHVAEAAFKAVFPGARIKVLTDVKADESDTSLVMSGEDRLLSRSNIILHALQSIATEHAIDYVEFPDWGGFAFATLQERLARGFLADSELAVRLHSTEAILVLRETRMLESGDLRCFDLERKSLLDCDLIVAHLESIAEETRRSFGIPPERWWSRVHITPPDLEIDRDVAKQSILPNLDTPIVFSSKFQEFKRPQIFVQAAVGLLRARPDYRGSVLLVCGDLDSEYARKILSLVPADLVSRFKLMGGLSAELRDSIIAGAISAFPTDFESFCLAAYEASLLGGVVVLNVNNPAFEDGTPWVDNVNSVKFDGSAAGLVGALEAAISLKKPLRTVTLPPLKQPWRRTKVQTSAAPMRMPGWPVVTVVLVNQNLGLLAGNTLASISAQSYENLRVVYVDDGSDDLPSIALRESLTSQVNPRLTVVRQEMTTGVAAARNSVTAKLHGDYVLYIRPGDLLADGYIRTSVECLERNRDYDVYVNQVSVYDPSTESMQHNCGVKTFVGEAPIAGPVFNYYSEGPRLCRASTTSALRHRPQLGHLCDWGWMHDAILDGRRVVASPRIEAFVPRHTEIDLAEPIDESRRLYHLLVANTPFTRSFYPVAAFSQVVRGAATAALGSDMPDWQRHMIENRYEGEVEFVANILGKTALGRLIRNNERFSRVLERTIRWATRFN